VCARLFRLCALLLALAPIASGGGALAQAQHGYPSWFQSPPSSDSVLWAVGYGPGYADLQDGMPAAKENAYESLRRARRVVLMGEKLYESAPGYGTAAQGKDFVELGRPDTLRSVAYVDSVKAAGMTLVLAAWPDNRGRSPSQVRRTFPERRPAWVQESLGGSLEGSRAMGSAPLYYNRETSWQRAERRARRKLAFRAATSIRSLDKSTEDWRHDVRSVTTGVDLRRLQVRARWADDERCYVLVEARVEEILVE
jgi:hypothetical protein